MRQLAARSDIDVIAISRHPDVPISSSMTPVELDMGAANANVYDKIGRPDVLLHLAWGGLPNYRATSHLESELPRQINFLDACMNAGLRRLVVAGTCLEYGMQTGCLDESLPTAPSTSYGQAKDRLREHLAARAATDGLQLAWARLFYLYGPGQAPTSLYSQLRAAIDAGATEFPMSPGDQQRDFLPVEDAAAYLCALALKTPDAGVVNVCGGTAKPVVTWVRTWLSEWGADLTLKPGIYPYPDYEPHTFWGSATKLHSLLGTV
jgi:nucleoside-diphosphate-sugar epimerase